MNRAEIGHVYVQHDLLRRGDGAVWCVMNYERRAIRLVGHGDSDRCSLFASSAMRRQLNDHDAGRCKDAKEFLQVTDGHLGLQMLQDDAADDEIESGVTERAKVRRVVADVRDGLRKAIQFCCK